VTWTQLGVHRKPCGLLNVEGFYDPLIALIDHAVAERFIRPQHRAAILVDADPSALLSSLADVTLPEVAKWITQVEA
jgi:predicted Rossmann-fold nucleotide-binding protein